MTHKRGPVGDLSGAYFSGWLMVPWALVLLLCFTTYICALYILSISPIVLTE